MITHFVTISLNSDITYRIFLSSDVSVVFVILLSIYNIKILILIVSLLNEFRHICDTCHEFFFISCESNKF